jgi:capsular exopolysaccharide synthesis family protein
MHPEYERLAQRLKALPRKDQCRVILVASAVAGEGASTVARNLALSLAQDPDVNLLLVDANLRSPSQHQAFEVSNVRGLSDIVIGEMTMQQGIRSAPDAGHHVLTSGNGVRDVGRLLSNPAFADTLQELRRRFTCVIIDAPPVTQFPDASTLARFSDGVVLVLRAESTRWQVAEEARRILEEDGGRILGAVLNERRYHIPEFFYKRL